VITVPSTTFADNLDRLLGLHRLTAREASHLLDVSTVALSEWRNGKRDPGLTALLRMSALFELAGDQLMTVPFADLLAGPLGDVDRYVRVEEKIARALRPVKPVKAGQVPDFPWLVSPDEMADARAKRHVPQSGKKFSRSKRKTRR
jgi:transcriptional regulator with XRE-family HTH domain